MILQKGGCVYMITNFTNTALYTGVTSDLRKRINEHRQKVHPGSFTAKYNCYKLVWYESFSGIGDAISREKQLKGGSRKAKEALVNAMNVDWKDLWDDVKDW